jgi:AraC-like DNA-binding protein
VDSTRMCARCLQTPSTRLCAITASCAVADSYPVSCLQHESPPRVTEWAKIVGMPRNELTRAFWHAFGVVPSQYFKRRQLETAKRLLRQTAFSLDAIGYIAGFGTRRTFFRAFRLREGTTPSQFRQTEASRCRG